MFIEPGLHHLNQPQRGDMFMMIKVHCAPTELGNLFTTIFYKHCVPTGLE